MKYGLLILICLCFIFCKNEKQQPQYSELFVPHIISTKAPEFATSVNAQQTEIFFNRTTDNRSKMWIMLSRLEKGKWSKARPLPFSTGEYLDVDPFLTKDGQRLYFSSNRPDNDSFESRGFNTWYAERSLSGWSAPQKAATALNSDSTDIFISLADNGNAYFRSERTGERHIMVCKFVDGQYQAAQIVELKSIDQLIRLGNPCIAADESFLIVAASKPGKNGTADLYLSWDENGKWSELINMGPEINSEYTEFAPGLSKDNETLYFTSERPGIVAAQAEGVRPPGDIYRISIKPILSKLRKK